MIVIFHEVDEVATRRTGVVKPGDKIAINTQHVKAVFQVTLGGVEAPYSLISLGDAGAKRVMGSFDEVVSKIQSA